MKKLIYNKFEKSKIASLRRVLYTGKTVVVLSAEEAERSVDYLLSQPVLGFDTETRPSFRKGVHYKCSLLQVASDDCCFLFRLNHIGLSPAIVRLLSDKTVTKVGLAWNNDLMSLRELGEFEPGTFVDLQDMARELGIDLLGRIPLVQGIRESGDAGEPVALGSRPDGLAFVELAGRLAEKLG